MIDLRSDTLTRPDAAMRQAMLQFLCNCKVEALAGGRPEQEAGQDPICTCSDFSSAKRAFSSECVWEFGAVKPAPIMIVNKIIRVT